MGQAKRRGTYEDRVKQAKKRGTNNNPTGRHKQLVTWYWGYRANQPDGFEFSNMTLGHMGFDNEGTMDIGANIKKSVDHDLEILRKGETKKRYNLTQEEFVAEEHRRMVGTARNINSHIKQNKGKVNVLEVMKDIIIFCCAVSICVAYGKLEQDEWNGDKFGHMEMDNKLWQEFKKDKSFTIKQKETA
jgi:hypothetical protein